MRRHELSDAQWARLEPLLPGRDDSPGARAHDNRRFLNAVL
ncbi:MAG: transposase [Rhodothermales bacterium]|nr:transposase [Rhodothermales bacterium]